MLLIQIFQPILLFLAKLLIPPFNHIYHLQLWAFSGLYSIHLLFSFLSCARQLPSLCFLDSRILLTSFVHCHLISHSLSLWVCTHCPCFTVTLEGLWVMFNQKIDLGSARQTPTIVDAQVCMQNNSKSPCCSEHTGAVATHWPSSL